MCACALLCVFLKSEGRFYIYIYVFLKLLSVCVHQSSLTPHRKVINSPSVAEFSASRQRKWFVLCFLCVVLHQLLGSCGWDGWPVETTVQVCASACKACLLLLCSPLLLPH